MGTHTEIQSRVVGFTSEGKYIFRLPDGRPLVLRGLSNATLSRLFPDGSWRLISRNRLDMIDQLYRACEQAGFVDPGKIS